MNKKQLGIALLVLAALLLLTGAAWAAAPAAYTLDWWTVDGGGGTHRTVGEYTLSGTAGQPDAGVLSGGDYTLGGGFWGGGGAVQYRIYLPLVVR